jgi:hypothetical protein
MEKLEGCDDRAMILDGDHLEILRWGDVQHRMPVTSLEPGEVVRDDKGKTLGLFGNAEERARISFGNLAATIWVPLERQPEAEAFEAKVDGAIKAAG